MNGEPLPMPTTKPIIEEPKSPIVKVFEPPTTFTIEEILIAPVNVPEIVLPERNGVNDQNLNDEKNILKTALKKLEV
jgi:hypothetical protein